MLFVFIQISLPDTGTVAIKVDSMKTFEEKIAVQLSAKKKKGYVQVGGMAFTVTVIDLVS